ncbi:MAG TPA: adenine phosphoribosyltransferase [Candidatus Polarisedimenticolaceae bacterium]|nr:adenine phosphoribosyltransferase [Candidatus Polarisedimenticolaceae bacterium]
MLEPELKRTIREIPDFPKPGINFYDVSTLFRNGRAFRATVDQMAARYRDRSIDAFAGIEARGFMLAGAMSYALGVGTVLVRKPGKLPHETDAENYTLEYGEATIEVHRDAIETGQRIVVVDDLLATGGTAAAAGRIIGRLGGRVLGYAFMVELGFLSGRKTLGAADVFSLLRYD